MVIYFYFSFEIGHSVDICGLIDVILLGFIVKIVKIVLFVDLSIFGQFCVFPS